ncbi:MAG: peptidase M22 [Oscillospiraceae bacterium]|nr:peptidase M22 [Oscillospiraceae bacterium]
MISLGIDTSNYTTSAALYDSERKAMISKRRLLKVKQGELGLRQSEAVFQHTVSLPEIIKEVFSETKSIPETVAVSVSPCDFEGSYMPCFMCGKGVAESIASAAKIPVKFFSHQAGHIAAVIYSSGNFELLSKEFLAFHISGGTTEAVLVKPDKKRIFVTQKKAGSLDLKAGQAIDRVGKMIGLSFPAGAGLDALSRKSEKTFKIKPSIKDGCCSLSGLQNRCENMLKNGEAPEDIAKYCIDYISRALEEMTDALLLSYKDMPVVFSGGVTGNSLIRERFIKKYGAVFASSGLSSDNAAGLAFLGTL